MENTLYAVWHSTYIYIFCYFTYCLPLCTLIVSHFTYCFPIYIFFSTLHIYCLPLCILFATLHIVSNFTYCYQLYILLPALHIVTRFTYCYPLYILLPALHIVSLFTYYLFPHFTYCFPLYILFPTSHIVSHFIFCFPLYILLATLHIISNLKCCLPLEGWRRWFTYIRSKSSAGVEKWCLWWCGEESLGYACSTFGVNFNSTIGHIITYSFGLFRETGVPSVKVRSIRYFFGKVIFYFYWAFVLSCMHTQKCSECTHGIYLLSYFYPSIRNIK